ncbi:MAG: PKD domain-containing protein, partial [Bacteroidetes bacterium]|nr:PKD domain-containing protein [Bacteroidota bacterium]
MWPDTAISLSDSGTVHFMNNNKYSDYWQWDFGDGATDTVQNPVHTYSTSGTFPVSVTVSMEGCTATATDTVYILPYVGVAEN